MYPFDKSVLFCFLTANKITEGMAWYLDILFSGLNKANYSSICSPDFQFYATSILYSSPILDISHFKSPFLEMRIRRVSKNILSRDENIHRYWLEFTELKKVTKSTKPNAQKTWQLAKLIILVGWPVKRMIDGFLRLNKKCYRATAGPIICSR